MNISDKASAGLGAEGEGGAETPARQAGAVAQGLRRGGSALLDLLYPPRCPVTGAPVDRNGALSAEAWARMTLVAPPQCRACGLPFALAEKGVALCAACAAPSRYAGALTGPRRLGALRSALVYDDASAPLILALKYTDRHDIVPALCRLMIQAGAPLLTPGTLLVPVPLHRSRLVSRRFNQAALLAAGIAGQTPCIAAPRVLARIRATPKQKGLGPAGRARNVAGAFAVRAPLKKGARVVLIDDVLTSGATLVACAKALRRAGATEVDALTLARVVRG